MATTQTKLICRICENAAPKLIPILIPKYKPLISKYLACAHVTFNPKDNLPKFFCPDCIKSLKAAHQFKELCEKTHNKLLSLADNEYVEVASGSETNTIFTKPYKFDIKTNPDYEEIDIKTNDYDEIEKPIESNNVAEDITIVNNDINCEEIDSDEDGFEFVNKTNDEEGEENSKLNKSNIIVKPTTTTAKSNNDWYGYYKCGLCDKELFSKVIFGKHIRDEHVGNKMISGFHACEYCPKLFNDITNLTKHIKSVHMKMNLKTRSTTSICKTCNKSFYNDKNLQRHINTVHLHLKPYKCEKCFTSFGQQASLTLHLKTTCNKKNTQYNVQYNCNKCSTTFKSYGYLRWHKISHLPIEQRKIEREKCKKLNKKNNRPEARELCELCGKSVLKAYYREHMNSHVGTKPHKCKVCSNGFRSKAVLKTHMLMHNGEKPFNCKTCDKSFRQLAHLREHNKLHTGEKPYKCSYCDKDFVSLSNIIEHRRRMHTGEKPYECILCTGVAFVNCKEVKRHLLKAHPDFDGNGTNNDGRPIHGYLYKGKTKFK